MTMSTPQPFQLNDSRHDPVGTTREERLGENTNVWVYEEVPRNPRCRWRCIYATGKDSEGMPGQILGAQYAAGFVPTGAVPGTPAERAWDEHVAQQTDSGHMVPAEVRAQVRELIRAKQSVQALMLVREATGWELRAARQYVTRLRVEMRRDDDVMAAVEAL